MPDHGRRVEFGVSIVPAAAVLAEVREVTRRAEALGLDLVGIQDHPYQWRFLDTWILIASLLTESTRIPFFPNLAHFPPRGPRMIAKQAPSLHVLSGGRLQFGICARGLLGTLAPLGGPPPTPGGAF